jgi:hypothetical protein
MSSTRPVVNKVDYPISWKVGANRRGLLNILSLNPIFHSDLNSNFDTTESDGNTLIDAWYDHDGDYNLKPKGGEPTQPRLKDVGVYFPVNQGCGLYENITLNKTKCSVTMLVKPTSFDNMDWDGFFGFSSGGGYWTEGVFFTLNRLLARTSDESNISTNYSSTLNNSQWYRFTATINNGKFTVYKDSDIIGTLETEKTLKDISRIWVGVQSTNDGYLDGYVDELSVLNNYILSHDQVKQLASKKKV